MVVFVENSSWDTPTDYKSKHAVTARKSQKEAFVVIIQSVTEYKNHLLEGVKIRRPGTDLLPSFALTSFRRMKEEPCPQSFQSYHR